MDDKAFADLIESIKEAGDIKRGLRKPERVFEFATPMKPEYDFSQGKRGAVTPLPTGKSRITIPLDDEVLEWFRDQVEEAGGGNYQTLINQVLLDYVRNQQARVPKEDV